MLQVDRATLVDEVEKVKAAFYYFSGILGTAHDREGRLDFEALGIHWRDLSSLSRPFIEEEIWVVIMELPLDKAPGTNGFTCRFYRSVRSIIKWDIICSFDALLYGLSKLPPPQRRPSHSFAHVIRPFVSM
jgi:hypothetical protein